MKPVNSSSISHVGHDPATGVLSVKFHNGKTYQYEGVSSDQAADMLKAESIGRHFMGNIRGKFKGVAK